MRPFAKPNLIVQEQQIWGLFFLYELHRLAEKPEERPQKSNNFEQ